MAHRYFITACPEMGEGGEGKLTACSPAFCPSPLLSVLPPAPSLPSPSSPQLGSVPMPRQWHLSFQGGLTTEGWTPALLFLLPRNPACCSTV